MKALIIAAGKGNRLRTWVGDRPKPLYKVAGLSLIERAILSAKKAGITEFVVVTGFKGDHIEKYLTALAPKAGVTVEFVHNAEWEKPNGYSVLAARSALSKTDEPFVLMMSDHIFDWRILQDLVKTAPVRGGVILAVDRRIHDIFDIEDATKVRTSEGAILEIGKEISRYDAIDTGLFLCTPGFFEALEQSCQEGQGGISDAMRRLASQGKASTHDIPNHFWQDVDTPQSLTQAKKVLFASVRKSTDGFVSRYFNRYVSMALSRVFLRTPITANQITWSALVLGLLTGYLVSTGVYFQVALGGILFQFVSIYDGCDGEVSKLKLTSSKFGEWLDTVCDNVTYLAFFTGVAVGVHRQGMEQMLPVSLLMIFGILMTLTSMYFHLIRNTDSGSLVTVQKEISEGFENNSHGFFTKFLGKVRFVMKRDFFALFFMVLCLLNQLHWILILSAIGANLTWIVFLTLKRGVSAEARLS